MRCKSAEGVQRFEEGVDSTHLIREIVHAILTCAHTLHGSRLTCQLLCRAQKELVSSPCVTHDVAQIYMAHVSYTYEHICLFILDITLEFHLNPLERRATNTCGSITRNEDCGSLAITNPLTGYDLNLLDIS